MMNKLWLKLSGGCLVLSDMVCGFRNLFFLERILQQIKLFILALVFLISNLAGITILE